MLIQEVTYKVPKLEPQFYEIGDQIQIEDDA
jgi:hypothetical protein